MIIKTSFLGAFPLGSDVCFNGVKIMQRQWHAYKRPLLILGKKKTMSPFFGDLYYATEEQKVVFFVAVETGLGHYHIFVPGDPVQQKLVKKIGRKS